MGRLRSAPEEAPEVNLADAVAAACPALNRGAGVPAFVHSASCERGEAARRFAEV